MRLSSWLLAVPVAFLLLAGGADAKDKHKNGKHHSNGKSTEKEWKRGTEGHRPQDLNGDGVISRHEWPGNAVSFRQLDRDGNGILDKRDRGYRVQTSRTYPGRNR